MNLGFTANRFSSKNHPSNLPNLLIKMLSSVFKLKTTAYFLTRRLFSLPFVDINECKDFDNGGCHHRCHNLAGSFYCTCRFGYRLQPNRRDCIGKAARESDVCFTTSRLFIHFSQAPISSVLKFGTTNVSGRYQSSSTFRTP